MLRDTFHKMSDTKLKTAVLGLDEANQRLLEAVSLTAYFQIEAVSDNDGKLAERIAAEYSCQAFDDHRQLIIQNNLDCLVVAAGINKSDEYARLLTIASILSGVAQKPIFLISMFHIA